MNPQGLGGLLRRWWPLAAVAGLLAAAALAAAHSAPHLDRTVRPQGTPRAPDGHEPQQTEPSALPGERPTADGIQLPDWLPMLFNVLFTVVVLGAVLAVLWLLISDFLRRRTMAEDVEPVTAGRADESEVIAILDAGLRDLSDTDQDPRRAVIACWLRLEEAADAAGVPRRLSDSPTDLVTRLLGGTEPSQSGRRVVSADILAGFAEVYRIARYATHAVDERMRDQARAALERVRAELAAPVATRGPAGEGDVGP